MISHLRAATRHIGASGAVVALVMLGVGFAPLFEGPGYESALASGLVVPLIAALSVAWRASRARSSFETATRDGLTHGATLAAIAYLTLLFHGFRAGFCSFGAGSLLFLAGPASGAMLAGAWGAYAGKLAPSRRTAVVIAFGGVLASMSFSFVRFLTSPMVFAFDPFVGFFSGTLYDTVIEGSERLVSYRAGTLGTVVFALALAHHLDRRPRLALRGFATVTLLLGATASLVVTFLGPVLGHWQTPTTIRRELGAETSSSLCDVIYPRTMRVEDARLFARDCDQETRQVAEFLGTPPKRVTAYLFADAAQKRRLMGAADVYIAKPWRDEIYVQVSGYPHPVLGHELAHVLAGSFGRGPFRVAGHLGGLLPDPGLIEGLAVAASPDDDELSPEAWSRAMLELGILPSLESIFSLDFLTHDATRAYTVAGAFVAFVRDRFGSEIVRRWYAGEPITALAAQSWDRLDASFRERVRSLPIPPAALALARARFERSGIFARRCPHEVDARKRDATVALGSGDARGAKRILDGLLLEEPRDPSVRLTRATCEERLGELPIAKQDLAAIAADPSLSRPARDRAEERLGDLALARLDVEEAAKTYEAIESRTLDEDHLRTLEVKLEAARNPAVRTAILALLVGTPEQGVDAQRAAEELGRWAERDHEAALPLYLLGRSAAGRGQWLRAAELLDAALDHTTRLPRVRREMARQRVIVACAARDELGVARGLAAWTATDPLPGNRDALLRALAERCLRD